MEDQAYIGELLGSIVYLIVCARLLRLGQHTREAPERLLGACFLFEGMSYACYVAASFPAFESLWSPLNFSGRVCVIPSTIFFTLFTWRVFRSAEDWGGWLVGGITVTLVIGIGGSAVKGDWDGFSIRSGWFWLEWIGYTLPYGWAGAEAFIEYRQARRRVRLGLCDRLICNRYLLWSLYGILSVGECLVILPQYAEYERTNQFTATWDALSGAFVIGSFAMIWLVFFPPTFYQRWIGRISNSSCIFGNVR